MQSGRLLFAAASASLLLVSGCAGHSGSSTSQAQTQAQAQSQVAQSKDDPNAVHCENVIRTGSRIGKKVCKTNAQWEEERRVAKEATEAVQRGGAQTKTMVGN